MIRDMSYPRMFHHVRTVHVDLIGPRRPRQLRSRPASAAIEINEWYVHLSTERRAGSEHEVGKICVEFSIYLFFCEGDFSFFLRDGDLFFVLFFSRGFGFTRGDVFGKGRVVSIFFCGRDF